MYSFEDEEKRLMCEEIAHFFKEEHDLDLSGDAGRQGL